MRNRLFWGLLGVWLLAVSLAITWPMATDPAGQILGHPECTAGCHVWVLWWAQNHLGDPHTPLLFFPHGADVVTLYGSDLLSPLLLALAPLSPVLAYNLWVVVLLVFGGCGAAALGRRLGAADGGAALGATVWVTAPFFQHELLNGTAELLAAGFLPWFARAVLDSLDRPSLATGLRLGVWTALGVLSSVYNLFFMAVVGLCIFLHRLSVTPSVVVTRPVLQRGLVGVAVAVVLLLPAVWLQLSHGATKTLSRRGMWLEQDPPLPDSFAQLTDWVDPRPADLPALLPLPGGGEFAYWTTCTVFLGFSVLVFAGLGLWRARSERVPHTRGAPLTPFLILVVVGMLIAMGPTLRAGGEVLTVLGWEVTLPAVVLADLFPPFVLTALHAYRYTSVVLVGLVALASRSVDQPVWAVVVLAEALALSPVPWPAVTTPVPGGPVLEALASAPEGAVLSVPVERENLGDLSWMMLAQTQHGKPVQDGGIHRRAGADATALFADNPLVLSLATQPDTEWPTGRAASYHLDSLRAQGFAYVLAPASAEAAVSWLSLVAGAPAHADDDWLLWTLEEAPPAGSAPAP